MATRILPGVYTSLNDLSQIPEGQTALTVGYVLKANKGPVNEPTLVTSPSDFLAKFTFAGKPAISDDPTYWDILKVLAQTNNVYVSRAAKEPLYGGAVVKKEKTFGKLISVVKATKQIITEGTTAFANGDKIYIAGTDIFDEYYTVDSSVVSSGVVTSIVTEELPEDYQVRFTITEASATEAATPVYSFTVTGNAATTTGVGKTVVVKDATVTANNKSYTVKSATYDSGNNYTVIIVNEEVAAGTDGNLYTKELDVKMPPIKAVSTSFANPATYTFENSEDLFLITGVNPGAYNGKLKFDIISAVDRPDELVYHIGADLGTGTPCTFDTMQLIVRNADTNEILETFLFSRDVNARTIDGISLYIEDVVTGSNYIQVVNNTNASTLTTLPVSTIASIQAGGGSDGDTVTANDLVAALSPFASKLIPVSIFGCGSSPEAESQVFQQALLQTVVERKDSVVFLNSRRNPDEAATLSSQRAQNIVDYKKNTLSSVSFYGTMYAPHVKTTDIYNSRQVTIGASSVAIAGWLNVINTLNYPYAYAGPQNGQVTGVTCDWKIGDESGDAQILNDASVNYIAFDAKVGRYYMQCQNTLQIANSSLRNLGAVLNILDIKEHFQTSLKEYLQLPITAALRRDIINTANDYLEPMAGVRFYNYSFQDVSTDIDIADNTLRYLLVLSPSAYSQKIYMVMNIVNANFDFSILQSM